MKFKHHKEIIEMLYNEWDLGKKNSGAKGRTCAWIYWFEILSESEKIVLKKDNNKIIGVCGYSKWESKKYIFRKKFYKTLSKVLILSPLIKYNKAMYQYNCNYSYLPKNLEKQYDGEISILIVDKSCRGNNVGKELLIDTFNKARDDDMEKVYILTDESCNYKVYEKLGCKKVYEKIINNEEPNICENSIQEKGFVYEKNLL